MQGAAGSEGQWRSCQGRQANERGEGDPVAGGSVGGNGTEAQRAEGRCSEGLEGVEGSEDGAGVLQDQ